MGSTSKMAWIWTMMYYAAVMKQFVQKNLETTRQSNLNIQRHVARGSIFISTGNSVTCYFRSAANRINLFILGLRFLDIGSTYFHKVDNFGTGFSCASFPLCYVSYETFLLLDPVNEAQLDLPPSSHHV